MKDLIVCRNFNDDEIFNENNVSLLTEFAERVGLSGNIFRSYIIYKLSHEPNLISTTIERTDGKLGESLLAAFKHDLKILFDAAENFNSPFDFIKNYKPTVASACK